MYLEKRKIGCRRSIFPNAVAYFEHLFEVVPARHNQSATWLCAYLITAFLPLTM